MSSMIWLNQGSWLTSLLVPFSAHWLKPATPDVSPPTPSSTRTADCAELTIGEIIEFPQNSARVRRRDRDLLVALAPLLRAEASPILLLSIEGYQEADEDTEGLALQRALAVQDELLSLGAHPARLVPLGHDKELWPPTNSAWSERRVEFDVLLPGTCDTR